MLRFSAPLLLLCGFAFTLPAWGQAPPDAGALRQQIDNALKVPLPAEAPSLQVEKPAPLTLPEGVTLTVKTFRVEGNTLLDEARLTQAVQGFTGRTIGFRELQQAAQAVATTYREAGWIVQTYLPQQDVTDGVVTIRVVEARFAGAQLEGLAPLRVALQRVLNTIEAAQPTGALLNADALDRGLLLADDLPGVGVTGTLESGAKDGETGLPLSVTDKPLSTGNVALDSGGSRSTGAGRGLATVCLDSPLHLGDQMRADIVGSQGSRYARAAYTLPIGNAGLRGGVNASRLDYRLVGAEFAALQGSGHSNAWGADLSYPLVRSRQRNLYLSLNGERTTFFNRANGSVQSEYGITSVALGLAGNLFDELGGSGANGFSLALERSRVDLGSLDVGENPAVAGSHDKLRYGASRQQALTPGLALYGALSGQYASHTLDSSGRFYLGGPSGVRAYPVNEGSGDRGQLVNLELRWHPRDAVTVVGFGDWGHVASDQHAAVLKGAGVSVVVDGPRHLNLQATLARRIGQNPDRSASGQDQDGSLKRNRVWLQVQIPF